MNVTEDMDVGHSNSTASMKEFVCVVHCHN